MRNNVLAFFPNSVGGGSSRYVSPSYLGPSHTIRTGPHDNYEYKGLDREQAAARFLELNARALEGMTPEQIAGKTALKLSNLGF